MAKIRYTGKEDKRIPGVGPVTKEWTPCPDAIAEEFKNEEGFEVDIAEGPVESVSDVVVNGQPLKNSALRTPHSALKEGGDS